MAPTERTAHDAWRVDEDDRLRELVEVLGPKHWTKIASSIPNRSGKQCRERWRNHLDPAICKNPFTASEDALILSLVEEVGTKWSLIARRLPGRTDNAVKNRYYSSLLRRQQECKIHRFSKEEDEKVIALVVQIGTKWLEIAQHLPSRTPKSIKNRYYSALKHVLEARVDSGMVSAPRTKANGRRPPKPVVAPAAAAAAAAAAALAVGQPSVLHASAVPQSSIDRALSGPVLENAQHTYPTQPSIPREPRRASHPARFSPSPTPSLSSVSDASDSRTNSVELGCEEDDEPQQQRRQQRPRQPLVGSVGQLPCRASAPLRAHLPLSSLSPAFAEIVPSPGQSRSQRANQRGPQPQPQPQPQSQSQAEDMEMSAAQGLCFLRNLGFVAAQ